MIHESCLNVLRCQTIALNKNNNDKNTIFSLDMYTTKYIVIINDTTYISGKVYSWSTYK